MSDKYKNGKIYTIRCKNDDTLIYVGSTVQPLFKRWFEHKCRVNNEKSKEYNHFLYQKMRETNTQDFYIELYEDFSCNSKEQLNKREGEIIREIGTLNKQIAGRKKKEYYEDNKNKILERNKEYCKEYKKANKEKILENQKEYYNNNKEKILEKKKEYREKNKQKISEKKKEYYQNNKENFQKYQESNKQKIAEYKKEYRQKKKNNN